MNFKILIFTLMGLAIGGALFFVTFDDGVSEVKSSETFISKVPVKSTEKVAYWEKKILELGGKEAYQVLKQNLAIEDMSQGKKHMVAHDFGEALYRVLGVDGVAVCDNDFAFGCYHSFFGWAILDKGLTILPELDQACINIYGEKGLGCQHGIGHGVIVELGYEKLALALDECSKLNWQGPIGGCTSGVLMEFNMHTMQESDVRDPSNEGYHYPCTEVEDRFIEACYFEQPAWWHILGDQDFVFVGNECAKAPEGKAREACYRGVGNVAAGTQRFDIPEIAKSCRMMPTLAGEIYCIEGATWIVSHEPGMEDKWQDLCRPYEGEYYNICVRSHDFI